MVEINYNEVEDIGLSEEEVYSWLTLVCERMQAKLEYLEITLCTDEFLLGMNREYLDHDYYTDILTFDLNEDENFRLVRGELYISMDRIKENAQELNVSWLDELHRVIVHGVLHLCGFRDDTEELKISMQKEENVALALRMF